MLAGPKNLYLPISRAAPVVFDRKNGARLRDLGGAGGTWALLVGEEVIHGPGKTGQLSESSGASAEQMASFSGHQMIVRDSLAWLHTTDQLSCLDRGRYLELVAKRKEAQGRRAKLTEQLEGIDEKGAKKLRRELTKIGGVLEELQEKIRACVRWQAPCHEPFDLILVGDLLFAGGTDRVAAFAARDGTALWSAPVDGDAYSLAAADETLFVSTDRGVIHAFATDTSGGER
jgi:hypothetical protein